MPLNRFESALFKTNEDITPQIGGISKTFVWWRTQTTSALKTLRPCAATSLLALDVFPLNLARFLILKGTLFGSADGYSHTGLCQNLKNTMDGSIPVGMLRMYIIRSLSH